MKRAVPLAMEPIAMFWGAGRKGSHSRSVESPSSWDASSFFGFWTLLQWSLHDLEKLLQATIEVLQFLNDSVPVVLSSSSFGLLVILRSGSGYMTLIRSETQGDRTW
jgi:hypothetical protein